MEEKYKKVLNRCMSDFIESFNPDDIVELLVSNEIISSNDRLNLDCCNSQTVKAITFIDCLQKKGQEAFHNFVEVLRTHEEFNDLVRKIDASLQEYDRVPSDQRETWQWTPMNQYQITALDHCKKELCDKLPFEDACECFLNVSFIEKHEVRFMEKLLEASTRRSVLIDVMKGKGLAAYKLLLDFLREHCKSLEEKISEAELATKEKEEQFWKRVSFTTKYERIEQYSGTPRTLNIILIGKTGSGKSATGNTLVGSDSYLEVCGIHSGTKTVQVETTVVNGITLNVMDTPGLFDTSSALSNEDVVLELMKAAHEFANGVHIFLFVCRADVRFTEEELKPFDEIEKHFGTDVFKYCLLVLTHADKLEIKSTFQAEIEANDNLFVVFKKVSKKAIAVENKVFASPVNIGDRQEQLLRAIIDVVSCNDGNPFSCSIFEDALKELEEKNCKKMTRVDLDNLTFKFLINHFPFKSLPELKSVRKSGKMSDSDINNIEQDLTDKQKSLLPKPERENCVNICFSDHEEFVDLLIQNKAKDFQLSSSIEYEDSASSPVIGTVLEYFMRRFQTLPDTVMESLKGDKCLFRHEIDTWVENSPYEKNEQSHLITMYGEIILSAFEKQAFRHELVRFINFKCDHVIRSYFRMKTSRERNFVIDDLKNKRCITPELHCKCLRVIPSKFKSGDWDKTIDKILFEILKDHVNVEESTLRIVVGYLQAWSGLAAVIFWGITPVLSFIGVLMSGKLLEALYVPTPLTPTTFLRMIRPVKTVHCHKCGGRHGVEMWLNDA